MTPIEYIEAVDIAFKDAKSKSLSRYSEQWGKFSRTINEERAKDQKSEADDTQKSLYTQALAYWFNRSELLEMLSSPKGRRKKTDIKRIRREGKKIKKDIVGAILDPVIGIKGIVDLFKQYHAKG